MLKPVIAILLFVLYVGYSLLVYTYGTNSSLSVAASEQQMINRGKQIYQQQNCQACHQIYGLGGYLGPDLTTAYSDKQRGEEYMRAMLRSGGSRMPNFGFDDGQINSLIAYLKYVDTTAKPIRPAEGK